MRVRFFRQVRRTSRGSGHSTWVFQPQGNSARADHVHDGYDDDGVWGGTSEDERRILRARPR